MVQIETQNTPNKLSNRARAEHYIGTLVIGGCVAAGVIGGIFLSQYKEQSLDSPAIQIIQRNNACVQYEAKINGSAVVDAKKLSPTVLRACEITIPSLPLGASVKAEEVELPTIAALEDNIAQESTTADANYMTGARAVAGDIMLGMLAGGLSLAFEGASRRGIFTRQD
jgi:hypothetical protein